MRNNRFAASRQGGYLLLEALVAFGILAVGVFALFSVHSAGRTAARSLSRRDAALEIANGVIEKLRATPRLADAADQPYALAAPWTNALPGAQCFVTVADYRADAPGLKRVTVRVSWPGRGRGKRSAVLETLIAAGDGHAK